MDFLSVMNRFSTKIILFLILFGGLLFPRYTHAQCPTPGTEIITVCNDVGGLSTIDFVFTTGTPPFTYILFDAITFTAVSDPFGPVTVTPISPTEVMFGDVPDGSYFLQVSGCGTPVIIGLPGIIVDSSLGLDLSATTTADCGGGIGSIDLTVTGGTPPYVNYFWTGGLPNQEDHAGTVPFGTYDVTVEDSDGCTETLTGIVVDPPPNAGTATPQNTCDNVTNFDLFTGLSGHELGGTWNDDDATGALTGNLFDASIPGPGTYNFTYTVTRAPCAPDMETVTVTVSALPDAGTFTAPFDVCSTDTNIDLFTALAGEDAGGTWNDDDATGALTGNIFDPSMVAPGNYDFTYTVTAPGCPDDMETVTVTVNAAPNAGTFTAPFDVCDTDNSVDLFTALAGEDAGGSWNDDDATGALTGNIFDATIPGPGSYNFTYTVTAPGCVPDMETVTVVVNAAPNAGTFTAPFDVCSIDTAVDLFTALAGEDAGGTWNDDDATGALTGNLFDASAVAPGNYDFTYTASSPGCPDDTETVTVTVNAAPNAGTFTPPFEVCETDNSVNLFTALTGEDAGGSWNDDDATGALTGNIFDATIPGPGSYDFTYTVTAPGCPPDNETVTVIVNASPNAGTFTAPFDVCSTDTAVDLFSALAGEDAGGSWNDDDATGALTGNLFDASAVVPGNYDFTYTASATGCPDDSETVTVTVNLAPNAGTNTPLSACSTDNSVDLFTGLTGEDAGGSWNDDDATGALTGNIFDATIPGPGTYNFTYTVTGTGCAPDMETVAVTVNAPPTAGTFTAPFDVCSTDTAVDLFTALAGEDAGGSWNDDDATGALTGNLFDASAIAPGNYDFTYTASSGGCPDDTETVTVTVNAAPNAGTFAGPFNACATDNSVDLFTALTGEDLGGSWNDDDATGALVGNIFDATIPGPGSYNFTYTVSVPGCTDDTETVTVTVNAAPNAGTFTAPFDVCSTDTAVDLFTALAGEDGGGSWNDDDVTGALTGNVFDASLVAPGNYDFTYTASSAGCTDDTETVTVTVNAAPNAGTFTAPFDACVTDNSVDLFAGLAGEDAGGSWNDDDATGALTGNIFDATIPGTGTYNFTYTVTASGCPADMETVTVTVNNLPNAGTFTGPFNACSVDTSLDLFTTIAGEDAGGVWNDDDATGALTGNIFDPSAIGPGVYNFTYTVSSGGCPDDTETATITVLASNAGTASPQTVCDSNSSFDLFLGLIGNDSGGTWNDDDATGALTGNIFDATIPGPGTYNFTYTINNPPCAVDAETVAITVTSLPDAGTAAPSPVCNSETAFDLFTQLVGNDPGGTWTDDDATGALTGNIFNASLVPPATYDFTYTVTAAGCPSDSETLSVTLTPSPNAGVATPQTSCDNLSSFDLFTGLTGNDAGGTWNDDDATGALTGNIFDPSVAGPGTYDFTYAASAPGCPDDLETVQVTVSAAPNAGTATPQTICITDTAYDLFTGLAGNDAGGVWSDDDATGALTGNLIDASVAGTGTYNFSYTVSVTGCADAVETLAVTIVSANAGTPSPQNTCTDITAYDLFTGLTGHDTGGTWNDDDATGAVTGNLFDASAVVPGTYNFTYMIMNPPCVPDMATVQVTVNAEPDAGAGTPQTLCDTETAFDLFTALTGNDPGGVWSDDDATGALTGNILDASVAMAGTFNFTYTTSNTGCVDDTETVAITIVGGSAGTAVASGTCTSISSYDLFTALTGEDPGGVWNDDDATGALTGNIFDPSAAGPGTYNFTYTINVPPCAPDTETVQVTVDNITAAVGDTMISFPDFASGSIQVIDITGGTDPYTVDINLVTPVFPGQSSTASGTATLNSGSGNFEILFENIFAGMYQIDITDANGCMLTPPLTPDLGFDEALFIPNVFTPNGDGINDTFFIRNLPTDGAQVLIATRWGRTVFQSDSYDNSWAGEGLSEGIYFYHIVIEGQPYTGYIEIWRGN